jgi:hypothetical protein
MDLRLPSNHWNLSPIFGTHEFPSSKNAESIFEGGTDLKWTLLPSGVHPTIYMDVLTGDKCGVL